MEIITKKNDVTIIKIYPEDSIEDIKKTGLTYNSKNTILKLDNSYSNEKGYQIFVSKKLLIEITKAFSNIEDISFYSSIEGEQDFIYELKKLKTLQIHFWADKKVKVDFSKIPQLTFFSCNWYPKFISNFDTQKNIKTLSLSDYKSKNLKPLKHLTELRYLRIHSGSLRNIEGIEHFKKLERLELIYLRNLEDISRLYNLENVEYIEFDSLYKLSDFSPLGHLSNLNHLRIEDSKKLESIQFVKKLKKLEYLNLNGTTIINDYDTTPAEHVTVFWGSRYSDKYNKHYPEKELHWVDGKWKKIAHLD